MTSSQPPHDDEANRLSRRLQRYARVGTNVGGVAAGMATRYVLGLGQGNKGAVALTEALGGLKGPLMKIAQLLSTIPDALPPEYAEELSKLQASAPPMGWVFVKRRMAAELGPDWERKFAEFSHESVASASLGQVHKARSLDGAELACKLQYPDMASGRRGRCQSASHPACGAAPPRAQCRYLRDPGRDRRPAARGARL